ncbi:class I SAM-dependent methyltransferase [Prosthecomicrobium sp. N25]|uniref:class I SAM-dependent methyltransferase n=1 Tax=Prosthecomicrobium sp. N25 TaxID=3129254 RepID=UPI003076AF86
MTVAANTDHASLMDRMYRHQRYFYDPTRKYYLLGRDKLLRSMDPPQGGSVLEIGCGTGRNLVLLGQLRPDLKLHGLDVSAVMLQTAGDRVARAKLTSRVRLATADASRADPRRVFRCDGFDRVFFSYTLSMIPDWQSALALGVDALSPGGELHIVDFGGQSGLPRLFRSGLSGWLRLFHVAPRPVEFYRELRSLARPLRAGVDQKQPYLGYAWSAVLRRPGLGAAI